jgi:hypothetical protein
MIVTDWILGPWNISRRLETRVGDRLRVQAIIEVDPPRAEACLKQKLADPKIKAAYENTVILSSIADFKSKVDAGELKTPKWVVSISCHGSILMYRAIFVATPPQFRGGLQSFNDIEVQLDQLFPDAHIFLEKPVATGSEAEKSIEEAKKVGEMLKKHKGNVSIGYVPLFVPIVTSWSVDTFSDTSLPSRWWRRSSRTTTSLCKLFNLGWWAS